MRRRIKRTTKQYIIVAVICMAVIGGAAVSTSIIMVRQIRGEYEVQLQTLIKEKENNQRNVFIATLDIKAGECITKENITKRLVYATQPEETYLREEDIGKILLVDIATDTQMLSSMVTDTSISSVIRETEYNVIYLNTNIINNDTVDIRIVYPNGENYVVLSKKIIKGIALETASCFLWLDEEELLRISAAIVDAAIYEGAKIYTTKYIEPNIQEASIITYTPSLVTLSLIESDPNIIERSTQELNRQVRKALENRLTLSITSDMSDISWEISSETPPIITTPTINEENGLTTNNYPSENSTSTNINILESDASTNTSISENGVSTNNNALENDTSTNTSTSENGAAANNNAFENDKSTNSSTSENGAAENNNAFENDTSTNINIPENDTREYGVEENSNYFHYYAEETATKMGVIEYGE